MKITRALVPLLLCSAFTAFAVAQHTVAPSDWQKQVDAAMTKAANDPQALPETRASIAASQVEFDTLCLVDARLDTHEAHIYFDQEIARQQRILHAMRKLQAPAHD
jgi:hypothetical protein